MNSNTSGDAFSNKNPSIISVDHQSILAINDHAVDNNGYDRLKERLNSTSDENHIKTMNNYRSVIINDGKCSMTHMLLAYAQQNKNMQMHFTLIQSNDNFHSVLNLLELHFNNYANNKGQIYFEGIFQILYDFKEQITEFTLMETMQSLKIDPVASCNFEDFIIILCHLPSTRQDPNHFFISFHELDHNNDDYITFEDIRHVLPHLISCFDEAILRTAFHATCFNPHNDQLSYFDFVTSLLLWRDYEFDLKRNHMN